MAQDMLVRIGHVAPISGPLSQVGKESESGARFAIDELNQRGTTIGGRRAKFELVPEDDAGDPKQATAVAQKLVDGKVNGVIGHVHSGTAIPASKIYSDGGIPFITPSAQSPLLTRQGFPTTFRIVPTDDDIVAAAATLAGRQGAALIVKSPKGSSTGLDLNALRQRVDRAKPDALLYDGPLSEALLLVPSSVKTIVATRCDTPKSSVSATAYCASLQGPPTPGFSRFKGLFKSKFKVEPGDVAPYTYDAVNVMAAAMVAAGSADPSRYLPALGRTSKYQGITGDITFNRRGDLASPRVNFYRLTGEGLAFDKVVVAASGTDGGCAEACTTCCSDKDGKFCAQGDRCTR